SWRLSISFHGFSQLKIRKSRQHKLHDCCRNRIGHVRRYCTFQTLRAEYCPNGFGTSYLHHVDGPRDFPSPNIYDLTLKMNADIGMELFWDNMIEIFVTN